MPSAPTTGRCGRQSASSTTTATSSKRPKAPHSRSAAAHAARQKPQPGSATLPEGNEVHRWAERHRIALVGKKLRVESPNGRFADAVALDNRKLERVLAKGKHLGYVFGKDRILHVHLGRYGDWTEGQMPLAEPRGALRLRMYPVGAKLRKDAIAPNKRHGWYSSDDGTSALAPEEIDWLELRGAAACELWTDAAWQTLLERLGPDALDGDDPQ